MQPTLLKEKRFMFKTLIMVNDLKLMSLKDSVVLDRFVLMGLPPEKCK
jgi:hypothetical protein